MVTSPECNGLFLPLLQTIQDSSAPADDHVDSYLALTERLREEEDSFLAEVCKHVHELTVIFKRDITSKHIELCQATLQTLGHCLYQEQISRTFTEQEAKDILSGLANVISITSDKGVCTRAMWCIAKQNLPPNYIYDHLVDIFTSIECALKKGLQSPTVDNEALCVVERFLEQLPDSIMKGIAIYWCNVAFSLTVSSAGKVRDHALSVISSNLSHIVSVREDVSKWLLSVLRTGLIADLTKLCNEKKELFVLKVWACIVPVLGQTLHRTSLINDILKLVEQGFKNSSVAVQVESYFAWQVLIDSFAESQDVLIAPRRVNLIMMPLLNSAVKERNEKVESARLSVWWHFVCSFEHKGLFELFDKVSIPLLQFIFGTGIGHVSLLKSKEGFGDLKCPPTPNTGKSICNSLLETPKATARRSLKVTPRTPTVINASFAKSAKDKLFRQGCTILEKILSKDIHSVTPNIDYTLESNLKDTVFQSTKEFEKHAKVLISAVREALKACGKEIPDTLASSLWSNLVDQVEQLVLEDRSKMFESYFLPLLAVAEEIIEGNYTTSATCLKILERLSHVSPDLLSHHNASLHSKENPQGSTAILIMQNLLSPQVFKEGQHSERLYIGFENLVSSGVNAPSGQLVHVQATLQLIESLSFVNKGSSLWRLWSHVVGALNEYILKSNEVNQGNALEHDFSAVYLAFMLPVKELLNESFDQEHVRIINKDLDNLYRSFSRAAALVSSLETNRCAEELCCKLLTLWDDNKAKDIHFLSGMGNLVSVVLECMDYTVTPVFTGKSPIKSPSKWAKKIQQPLGNYKSALVLTSKVMFACDEVMKTKKTAEYSGVLAVILTNIVDKLSVLYQHLNGPSEIASATNILAHSVVPIFCLSHQSTKVAKSNMEKAVFTIKFIQKVEKLWVDILTSVQSRHGEPYSSELLSVLSPLLEVTFVHHRRQLKNQTILFWNSTFSTAQTLEYPENLRLVLLSVKDRACLTLPGWNAQELSTTQTSEIEMEEPSQMTQPQGSPIRIKPLMFFGGSPKVKGSFLHKAAEAEKAVQNSSPKKAWTEPRLPSKVKTTTRNTHARRKLPLSLLDDDSQDYVKIAPSPTKKRLLTEHQKEVMKEKRAVPALYNFLDQSQDATFMSQETLYTPSPVDELPPLLKDTEQTNKQNEDTKPTNTVDIKTSNDSRNQVNPTQMADPILEIPETMDMNVEETELTESENVNSISCQETPTKDQPVMSSQEEVTSPDIIPSSQLSSGCGSPSFKSLRRSINIPVSSMVVLLNDMTGMDESLKGITQYFSPRKDKLLVKDGAECKASADETNTDASNIVSADAHDQEGNDNQVKKPQVLQLAKVKSSGKKQKNADKVSDTSPVSGRTRRGRHMKLITPKKQNHSKSSESDRVTENFPEEQQSCQNTENSSETQDSIEIEKCENRDNSDEESPKQPEPEPEVEKSEEADEEVQNEEPVVEDIKDVQSTAHVSTLVDKDVTSSPVSCAKIIFMKPNTGSPTQTSLKAFQSPVASPTTGILKRCTGRYDSPSPPIKVRRVSFALPLAQESQDKESSEAALPEIPSVPQPDCKLEATTEPEIFTPTPSKGSDSTAYTVIKRRRKTPSKVDKGDATCIYPDLVDCSLPVEQILPSLTSFTWSRGLGHVVYAQNIRTIGNLSALKEYQIKNLPIRSPKVQTLRTALESFHQKTKGLKARASLLSGQEKKSTSQPSVTTNTLTATPSIPECHELPANDTNKAIKEQVQESFSTVEELKDKTEMSDESSLSKCDVNESTKLYYTENKMDETEKDAEKTESEEQMKTNEETNILVPTASDDKEMTSNDDTPSCDEPSDQDSAQGSFTPPLPVPGEDYRGENTTDEENTKSNTPTRSAFTKPIVLFTPTDDESEETEPDFYCEVMSKLENTEGDVADTNLAQQTGGNVVVKDEDSSELGKDVQGLESIVDSHHDIEEQKSDIEIENCPEELPSAMEVAQDDDPAEKTLCQSLTSILETATPEVLARLSSEEIFVAHRTLTDLMSRVVNALQSKMTTS